MSKLASTPSLTVHRSASEIGGNLLEIVAGSGERLILDAGRPLLAAAEFSKELVPPSLDVSRPATILLSHAHRDHWGLLDGLPDEWPVWSGSATERLIRLNVGMMGGSLRQCFRNWAGEEAFEIGPFRVTPLRTDHSAYDAHMLLIEVDGRRILYSGDFRTHGRNSGLVEQLIVQPPERLDLLVLEGANLGTDKPTMSESELEDQFVSLFERTSGRVFVTWSAQNVDRTVTLHNACRRTGRKLAVDLYALEVMEALGASEDLPRPGSAFIAPLITRRLRKFYARRDQEAFIARMAGKQGIPAKKLNELPGNWVVMTRRSMVKDLEHAGVVPDENDAWSFSMWQGYLGKPDGKLLRSWFHKAQVKHLHTSGHASAPDLVRFAEAMNASAIVPVHGEAWDEHAACFPGVCRLSDGEVLSL